ncbi:Phospholipase DDHD2 [Carex littledalei]|uniref:Phospholipase DDHD2 n=1 Tax=Carex littledalei TaxID=544730 RepID=A0A833RMR3_9POAL|nr:Phospholipase DDHD2 [Carex littledalei]
MSSRSKVTITLGRRGQVVKTGANAEMKNSGGKRPIRERLGANFEDSSFAGGQSKNKRQRMESNGSGLGAGILDQQIGGGDLRLKLIQKGVTKKPPLTFNGEVDLREKLLRKLPKKPASNYPPNRTTERERERQGERERQRDREIDLSARRVAPYTSWSYDTGNELHASHRGGCSLTPPPPPPPPPLNRPYADLRPVGMAGTVGSRPCSSAYGLKRGSDLGGGSRVASDYATNGVASMEMRKNILPSPPRQRQPELPATVEELLTALELDKYKILFKVEEVDMGALKQMGDSDLKELGIPMGPRKKILLAVRSSAKPRPH